MSMTQSTTILWTLVVFGACTGEHLPPAIPEERSVFSLPEALQDDMGPRHAPRLPIPELITPPPSMIEVQTRFDYVSLRKAPRHRPKQRFTSVTPVNTPLMSLSHPQVIALPVQDGAQEVPRQEPTYAPSSFTPLRKPEKAERPEKIVAEANSASLMSPSRQRYGRGGVVQYPYEEGRAYLVLTAPDHPTVVTLPKGERLAVVPAMNPERFDLGYAAMGEDVTRQEAVFIRPTAPGYDATTALVTKQGHIYYLQVRSVEQAAMMGVTWQLPQEAPAPKAQEKEALAVPGLPGVDLTRLHTGYAIERTKGSPPWVPVQVFDDGQRTVIKFQESLSYTNAPAVFTVHANGEPGVVEWTPYEAAGQPDMPSYYVVGGIWPRLILRSTDAQTVTITRSPVKVPVYQPVARSK